MPESSPGKSADQKVSEAIVASLLEKSLVTSEDAKTLAAKIATGTVTSSEWKVMLKMAANRKSS